MSGPTKIKKAQEPKTKALPMHFRRPYIRMEITSDDSLKIAACIIGIFMTAIFILQIEAHLSSLLNFMAEKIALLLSTHWDLAGYAASSLVITAFCMKDILYLRAVAILSNFAFLTYGIALGLEPIWLLHGILLPLNCWRLRETVLQRRDRDQDKGACFN